jgi:hypothetical protein
MDIFVSSVTTAYGPGTGIILPAPAKISVFSTEPTQPITLLGERYEREKLRVL